MSRYRDLTGQKFGKLIVLHFHEITKTNPKRAKWMCRCDCGKEVVVYASGLTTGHSKTCGCTKGKNNRTHSMTKTPVYRSWIKMKGRCDNPNNDRWKDYGGRGITYHKTWKNFETFYHDMGPRPVGTSLDRIDNDGDYTQNNCRWATPKQQQNNTRSNVILTYNGETKTISEWAEQIDIAWHTFRSRLNRGWSIERALKTKTIESKLYTHDGKSLTLKEWAIELNVTEAMLRTRLSRGCNEDQLFLPKKKNEILVTIDGETKMIGTWAKQFGIAKSTIHTRIKRGWLPLTALTTPVNKKHSIQRFS